MAFPKILITDLQHLLYGRWNGGIKKQVAGKEAESGGWQELLALWREQRLALIQKQKRIR